MKKIIFIMLAVFATAYAQAQTTTPRYGYSSSRDRTMRTLTMDYIALTDAAGHDSTTIAPKYHHTQYKVTLTDSLKFSQPTTTGCYFGDRIELIANGASGTKVMFTTAATKFKTAGTATLSTGGRAIITLIFDGANWVEAARVVQ